MKTLMERISVRPAPSMCSSKQQKEFILTRDLFSFRKIKPVDGLILKTPIAFQKDSDPDMIPIRKEGMAVCEKCGAIGVKHSFYTKERRFCSQTCAKSFNESSHLNPTVQGKFNFLHSLLES